MAQRQMDLSNAFRCSRSLSLSVQRHLRNTSLIRKNLNLLHRCTRTFGGNAKRLEHSFLTHPARGEGRLGGRLGTAVCNLSVSEVA